LDIWSSAATFDEREDIPNVIYHNGDMRLKYALEEISQQSSKTVLTGVRGELDDGWNCSLKNICPDLRGKETVDASAASHDKQKGLLNGSPDCFQAMVGAL
jgi:hypothetical protein